MIHLGIRTTLCCLLLVIIGKCIAVGQKRNNPLPPSTFFSNNRAKILFVGTFHFDYPGLDAHVTANSDKIDVLSDNKKKEVTELVNYIKRFKPTKIAIEASPKWKATEKLREYKNGAYRMQRDERYQLGMRLANEMKLDTIYAIDASSMVSQLKNLDSNYVSNLFKEYDYKSNDTYSDMYDRWYKYEDKLRSSMNLLDYFKLTNSKTYHQTEYGAYLIGDFKLDDTRGADALAVNWYDRNLRIFRKLQQITKSSEDRILVIFGNGHGSILRQLLESSPEFQLIEFTELQ